MNKVRANALKIWGNTIVKNEDRFLWFGVMSVIKYLDKILIWDSGSTDQTIEVIKELQKKFPKKIIFKEIGEVDKEGITEARQKMLEETKSDWVFLLDGDEVWWENSIKRVREVIDQKGDNLDFLVNPTYNLVGDIYHYQEERAGQYEIKGRKGHLNIRAVNRKIPGLHFALPYGQEGLFDSEKPIQEREKVLFLDDAPYLHFTHLSRSSKKESEKNTIDRSKKRKYEIGISFPNNFKFPEALYSDKPSMVLSPWDKSSLSYKVKATLQTPFKKIKRRIFK